ncbi:hypothetical protein Hanom_Chr05g00387431 [Helianthus anomalus]
MIVILDYNLYDAFIPKQVSKLSSLHQNGSISNFRGQNVIKRNFWSQGRRVTRGP